MGNGLALRARTTRLLHAIPRRRPTAYAPRAPAVARSGKHLSAPSLKDSGDPHPTPHACPAPPASFDPRRAQAGFLAKENANVVATPLTPDMALHIREKKQVLRSPWGQSGAPTARHSPAGGCGAVRQGRCGIHRCIASGPSYAVPTSAGHLQALLACLITSWQGRVGNESTRLRGSCYPKPEDG